MVKKYLEEAKACKRKILADALLPREIIRHVIKARLEAHISHFPEYLSFSGLDGNVGGRKKARQNEQLLGCMRHKLSLEVYLLIVPQGFRLHLVLEPCYLNRFSNASEEDDVTLISSII